MEGRDRETGQIQPGEHQQRSITTPTGVAPGYRLRRVKTLPPGGQNMDFVWDEEAHTICVWEDDHWVCLGGGLCTYEYVVDSAGNGTHTKLFGPGGALEAAETAARTTTVPAGVTSGPLVKMRSIWVCPNHVEFVDTPHLPSGGTFEVAVTSGYPGDFPVNSSTPGDQRRPVFYAPAGNVFIRGGVISMGYSFENVSFKPKTFGIVEAIWDDGGAVWQATSLAFRNCQFGSTPTSRVRYLSKQNFNGRSPSLVVDNCDGNLDAVSKIGFGQTAPSLTIRHSRLVLNNIVEEHFVVDVNGKGGVHFEKVDIVDNYLDVAGYGLRIMRNREMFNFQLNTIEHFGNGPFIEWSNAIPTDGNSLSDAKVSGNIYQANAAGAQFVRARSNFSQAAGFDISGNLLKGPGSGTAIEFDSNFVNVRTDNLFYGWSQNVVGGSSSLLPAPASGKYVIIGPADPALPNARTLAATAPIAVSDGGPSAPVMLSHNNLGELPDAHHTELHNHDAHLVAFRRGYIPFGVSPGLNGYSLTA